MLADLIKNHAATLQGWYRSVPSGEDLPGDGEAHDAFEAAEWELVCHQCQTPEEVQQKIAYAAECPSFADCVRLDHHVEFLSSLRLPPNRAEVSPQISKAISDWQEAETAFRTFCNASTDLKKDEAKADKLYEVQAAAEDRLTAEPCINLADVRAKAAIVIGHEGIFESVTNGMVDGEHVMNRFLRSLMGVDPVDSGGN